MKINSGSTYNGKNLPKVDLVIRSSPTVHQTKTDITNKRFYIHTLFMKKSNINVSKGKKIIFSMMKNETLQ